MLFFCFADLQASCCTEQAMVERRVQTLNDTTVANDTTGVVVGSNGSPAASPDDGTSPVSFVFEDDQHNSRTLKALDMMRRNKHFCDLILHVSVFLTSSFFFSDSLYLDYVNGSNHSLSLPHECHGHWISILLRCSLFRLTLLNYKIAESDRMSYINNII